MVLNWVVWMVQKMVQVLDMNLAGWMVVWTVVWMVVRLDMNWVVWMVV